MSHKQFIFSKILIFFSGVLTFLLTFYNFIPNNAYTIEDNLFKYLQFPSTVFGIVFTVIGFVSVVVWIVLFFKNDYIKIIETRHGKRAVLKNLVTLTATLCGIMAVITILNITVLKGNHFKNNNPRLFILGIVFLVLLYVIGVIFSFIAGIDARKFNKQQKQK